MFVCLCNPPQAGLGPFRPYRFKGGRRGKITLPYQQTGWPGRAETKRGLFSAESTPYCDEKKELAGSRARTEAGQSNTKGTKADETQRRRTGKRTQRKQKGQERKQQQKTVKRKRNQKRRAQREQVRRPSKHVFHVRRRMVFMFDVDHFGARIGIQIMLGSSKRRRRKTERVNQLK